MGKEVLVYEDADGAVSIRTESGFELDARAFDRVPRARIQPGTVVEDKLLGRVLEYARAQQQDAEAEREQLSRTKRERRLAASRIAASETK